LFKNADRPGYLQLQLPIAEVKPAIFGHPEFTTFNASATQLFARWKAAAVALLKGFAKDSHPKPLIATIAEELLATFQAAPLLDAYDVYQHLMDYWAATMQDDCYLIAGDGWREAAQPRLIVEDKNKKTKTRPDFVLGKRKFQTELIPPSLIIQRWFPDEQADIDTLGGEIGALEQQIEELVEENSGEEATFAGFDKINRVEVSRRLKDIENEQASGALSETLKVAEEPVALREGEETESDILLRWLNLDRKTTELNRKLKLAQDELTKKVADKYPRLTEDEIKTLVVDDKWLATIAAAVQGELGRVSQTLTGRIRQLAERYANPLPQLTAEVARLAARVDGHLEKMGAVWK
jgi:type I restriction enzyme M protein